MTRTPQDDKLHTALNEFVADAMSHLRKTTDIAKIPVITRFELGEKRGRKRIVRSDRPNWWQTRSYIRPVVRLSTFRKAAAACLEHPLIRSRDGKVAYALDYGVSFSASDVPSQFLTECVARQNGLRFSQGTFENVFADLGNFLTTAGANSARLIAPLDMVELDQKEIQLGPDARILRLSLSQVVDLANHCSVLELFYGHGLHSWFNTVLELDCGFEWKWLDENVEDEEIWSNLRQKQEAQRPVHVLMSKLMREIVLLRSLLRKPVYSCTCGIDYRGWNSVISSGGQIFQLPWVRFPLFDPLTIDKVESKRFTKLRDKFLSIQDGKTKRRILAAMRKLSSSLERYYASDRLLDAVAGLEGLLVNSRTELRHQFAEHAALLLEREPAKRATLFREMRDAYDFRSRVAHGDLVADDLFAIMGGDEPLSKDLPECNAVNQLSRRCSELLHKAITICIDRGTVDFDWIKTVMTSKDVT